MRNKAKDRKTLKQRLRSWLWGFLLADGVPDKIKDHIAYTVAGKNLIDGFCDGNSFSKATDPATSCDNGAEAQRTAEDTRR